MYHAMTFARQIDRQTDIRYRHATTDRPRDSLNGFWRVKRFQPPYRRLRSVWAGKDISVDSTNVLVFSA